MEWQIIKAKELKVGDVIKPINHRGPLCKVTAIVAKGRKKFFEFKVVTKEDPAENRFPIMGKMDKQQPLIGYISRRKELTERQRVIDVLNKWVGRIGGGFHPDTDAVDYEPPLRKGWQKELTCDMIDAFDICDTHGLDIYELAMSTEAWKRCHGKEPAREEYVYLVHSRDEQRKSRFHVVKGIKGNGGQHKKACEFVELKTGFKSFQGVRVDPETYEPFNGLYKKNYKTAEVLHYHG